MVFLIIGLFSCSKTYTYNFTAATLADQSYEIKASSKVDAKYACDRYAANTEDLVTCILE